jgi:hypothetical protein
LFRRDEKMILSESENIDIVQINIIELTRHSGEFEWVVYKTSKTSQKPYESTQKSPKCLYHNPKCAKHPI